MAVPDPGDASYPPHVPARKRATVTPPLPEVDPNEVGPNGHGPAVEALLKGAVEEAARLLDTDGAMVYLLDPETQILRFGFDAGIHNERTRRWLRWRREAREPALTRQWSRWPARRSDPSTRRPPARPSIRRGLPGWDPGAADRPCHRPGPALLRCRW